MNERIIYLEGRMPDLGSEVERGLDVFVLGAGRPPRVVQLKTFIAEAGSAVRTALGRL